MSPRGPRCPDIDVSAVVADHARHCRRLVRKARLAGAGPVPLAQIEVLGLTSAQRERIAVWRKVGLEALDAIRIVVDPAMRVRSQS